MKIALVDYGMGNLYSVAKAFEAAGVTVELTQDPAVVRAADRIVVPGQGAFGDAVKELHASGMWAPVIEHLAAGKPYFGICLGMQLLMEGSEEAPGVAGFGRFKGQCRLLRIDAKVPHMGWNELHLQQPDCPLFADLGERPYCYFCHSYYADPEDKSCVAATTDYDIDIPIALWKDNVVAVQFHPEKSQRVGLQLLHNFLGWNGSRP